MKKIIVGSMVIGSFALASVASAHAVVKPAEVPVGAFQTFTLGVPSETEFATTAVRLEIPEGVQHVTPNVKLGWRIELIKSGEDVREIRWSGGRIPRDQRDEFLFSAQVPAEETKLAWKVSQTYSNGSVVEWDLDPSQEIPDGEEGAPDTSEQGPYSVTKVIDGGATSDYGIWGLVLSVLALLLAGYAVVRSRA
jgi:uncharacterized protein YcnI